MSLIVFNKPYELKILTNQHFAGRVFLNKAQKYAIEGALPNIV